MTKQTQAVLSLLFIIAISNCSSLLRQLSSLVHAAEPDATPSLALPKLNPPAANLKPFEYDDVGPKIPNYPAELGDLVAAKPLTLQQRPLSAAESLKHYQVPEGFELKLFASEENIALPATDFDAAKNPQLKPGKAIAMNWDERGRLWICETLDYPNNHHTPGHDRIRICEDTDGDGLADQFTIFAEKLSIPTAILPIRGGVVVQNAHETIFLRDSDNDGKADVRKTLITGWNIDDTHAMVSNFFYGHDNWIYAVQGYNDSHPKPTSGKDALKFRMGIFRFKLDHDAIPNVTTLEFVRSTSNNTYGLGITEEGNIFASTANHNPSNFMPIANRYYERVRGWAPQLVSPSIADTHLFVTTAKGKIRQGDHHGGYTAACGHVFYTARNYPRAWWNRTAIVCEPTGHIVGAFTVQPNGAGFKSKNEVNLLQSDDEWASPVAADVGPDGNVWILDWYNFVIMHNGAPREFKVGKGAAYISELRDQKHWRVYRLVYTGAKNETSAKSAQNRPAITSLHNAKPNELLEALKNSNLFWRRQAQKLIIERKLKELVPELCKLVQDQSVDEVGLNVGAIHALWTLEGLGMFSLSSKLETPSIEKLILYGDLSIAGLKHPSAAVRCNALRSDSVGTETAEKLVNDPDPQVRLASILALTERSAHFPSTAPDGEWIAKLSQDQTVLKDRWLREALTCAAAAHAKEFIAALAKNSNDPKSSDANRQSIVAICVEHFARSGGKDSDTIELLNHIAKLPISDAEAAINGLYKGWPKNRTLKLTAETQTVLVALLDKVSQSARAQIVRLGMIFGNEELKKHEWELINYWGSQIADTKLASKRRLQAAQDLLAFAPENKSSAETVLAQITPKSSPDLTIGLLSSLESSTAENLGTELVRIAKELPPNLKEAALRTMLQRSTTASAFLDAVESRELLWNDLNIVQQQSLLRHIDKSIQARATKIVSAGGGLPNPDREKVIEQYVSVIDKQGDVAKGKALFTTNCAKCHRYRGEGSAIGPDLTGMAVHPKRELLTHILDPNRSVEANFRQYNVLTNDGRSFTGLLAAESRTSIDLVDIDAKRRAISRENIESMSALTQSLMPEGFEKQLSHDQMTDLLSFITQRSQFVPISIAKFATSNTTTGMFLSETHGEETMVFDDYGPKVFEKVPFELVDPQGKRNKNAIMLHGPLGKFPPTMPKSLTVPCHGPIKAVHLLSGVSGWGFPAIAQKSTSMIVRFHFDDKTTEDHKLLNGVHFADYISHTDVPESKFAFDLRGRQLRYLNIPVESKATMTSVELIKGSDRTAPVVMAITVETR